MHPDLVALLGDEQYEVGKLSDFENSFEEAWGGLKYARAARTGQPRVLQLHQARRQRVRTERQPATSHTSTGTTSPERRTRKAKPATTAAPTRAGTPTTSATGTSSRSISSVTQRRSATTAPLPIRGSSPRRHSGWRPTFTATMRRARWRTGTSRRSARRRSAATGVNPAAPGVGSAEGGAADAWWQLLYKAHASLILNGHEHVYARFKPMDPAGNYDPKHGITQITVGTGGEDLDTLATTGTGAYSNPNVVTASDRPSVSSTSSSARTATPSRTSQSLPARVSTPRR